MDFNDQRVPRRGVSASAGVTSIPSTPLRFLWSEYFSVVERLKFVWRNKFGGGVGEEIRVRPADAWTRVERRCLVSLLDFPSSAAHGDECSAKEARFLLYTELIFERRRRERRKDFSNSLALVRGAALQTQTDADRQTLGWRGRPLPPPPQTKALLCFSSFNHRRPSASGFSPRRAFPFLQNGGARWGPPQTADFSFARRRRASS